jgi:hypothetical protein
MRPARDRRDASPNGSPPTCAGVSGAGWLEPLRGRLLRGTPGLLAIWLAHPADDAPHRSQGRRPRGHAARSRLDRLGRSVTLRDPDGERDRERGASALSLRTARARRRLGKSRLRGHDGQVTQLLPALVDGDTVRLARLSARSRKPMPGSLVRWYRTLCCCTEPALPTETRMRNSPHPLRKITAPSVGSSQILNDFNANTRLCRWYASCPS